MQLDTPRKISQSLSAFNVCAMDPLHVGKQRFPLQTLSSCIAASCYVAVMMHINIACAQNSWRSVSKLKISHIYFTCGGFHSCWQTHAW